MRLQITIALCLLSLGCETRSPRDDYNDFVARTASYRESACKEANAGSGQVADISGTWVIRSLLNGGITLGLRVELVPAADETAMPPRRFDAKFWLEEQPLDMEPLLVTPAEIDDEGAFELIASPLNLGPDVLSSETTVTASVRLLAVVQDDQAFCGVAEGMATSPLELDLSGSTFGALRYSDDLVLEDVPFRCPGDPCAPDMGVDMDSPEPSDAGVVRPESPELMVDSARRDLSGDWFLTASLSGLPLKLWVALVYREIEDQASIDGSLRLVTDTLETPARAYFSATIDPDGHFEVWLPGLALDVNGLSVEGDVLLAAATLEESWCGVAAGQVRSPVMLPLEGSTFGAVRWTPGPEEPDTAFNLCP